MNYLRLNKNRIAIAGIIISAFLVIAGWYVDKQTVQQNAEIIFNQNENKGTINVNQIANFALVDKRIIFENREYKALLTFKADGVILSSAVCFTAESDAKILEINIEGLSQPFRYATTTNKGSSMGMICLYNPRSNTMLWVKFDKEPKEIKGIATNVVQSQ